MFQFIMIITCIEEINMTIDGHPLDPVLCTAIHYVSPVFRHSTHARRTATPINWTAVR